MVGPSPGAAHPWNEHEFLIHLRDARDQKGGKSLRPQIASFH